jgi:hypothetical protein
MRPQSVRVYASEHVGCFPECLDYGCDLRCNAIGHLSRFHKGNAGSRLVFSRLGKLFGRRAETLYRESHVAEGELRCRESLDNGGD